MFIEEPEEIGPKSLVIEDLEFVCTCWACPEQYDVYDSNDNQVAYVRLRWGTLRVNAPDYEGEEIYCDNYGDGFTGIFDPEDREDRLKIIANKIKEHYETTNN